MLLYLPFITFNQRKTITEVLRQRKTVTELTIDKVGEVFDCHRLYDSRVDDYVKRLPAQVLPEYLGVWKLFHVSVKN